MARIAPETAADILTACGAHGDFHALRSSVVEELLKFANEYGYRKPRNANGSRARYFHAMLKRKVYRLALY